MDSPNFSICPKRGERRKLAPAYAAHGSNTLHSCRCQLSLVRGCPTAKPAPASDHNQNDATASGRTSMKKTAGLAAVLALLLGSAAHAEPSGTFRQAHEYGFGAQSSLDPISSGRVFQ